MRTKRRRLRSVEAEIARIDAPARPQTYEVIREHPDCRVQLHAWGFLIPAVAESEAAIMNASPTTMATSGKIETGWIYKARRSYGR